MDISQVQFDDKGLVPAVVRHAAGGEVLMLGYANADALEATARTGYAHFYSRSRRQLWQKGETSGNRLRVRAVRIDCDGDAVVYDCDPEGPTCHTGAPSCFHRTIHEAGGDNLAGAELLAELEQVLRGRMKGSDAGSYTARLLQGDPARIRRKVSEEALEVVLASESADGAHLADEVADLWFHTLMLLVKNGVGLREVLAALAERRGKRRIPGTKTLVDAAHVTGPEPNVGRRSP